MNSLLRSNLLILLSLLPLKHGFAQTVPDEKSLKRELAKFGDVAALLQKGADVRIVSPTKQNEKLLLPAAKTAQILLLPTNPGAGRYWSIDQSSAGKSEISLLKQVIAIGVDRSVPGGGATYNCVIVTSPTVGQKISLLYNGPGVASRPLSKVEVQIK